MVIDGAGQVSQFAPRIADMCRPRLVVITHDVAGIGDVKIIANQLYAERRVQVFKENMFLPAAGVFTQ